MEQIIVTHLDGSRLKLQSKENVSRITRAEQRVEKLGVDTVDISVESANKLSLFVGDKITVFGRDYTLNLPAKERKLSENRFSYDMQFEGVQYDLLRCQYNVNLDTTGNIIQDLSGMSLTGDIKTFLDVLIANANRIFPNRWAIGTYPQNTETKTLTFSDSDTCLSVLQSLCSADNYDTDFRIAIDSNGNRTINVGASGSVYGHTFEYGMGKGLYELSREKVSSNNIINRLFVYGGSKNINTSKYRADRICLPTKAKSVSYLEDAASIAKYGVWESTKVFEDVYPHRVGQVSSVGSNVYQFIDAAMPFDLNERDTNGETKYLLPGQPAKVHFNTGKLAGYEFEISNYDHAAKTFTIIKQTDSNGYSFPSETLLAFQLAVGDKYVLIDIYQPQTYIDAAESEVSTKGQEYLTKYSKPQIQYSLSIDRMFLKRFTNDVQGNIFWVGDLVPIKDTDLDVDKSILITGFTRNLLDEYIYSLTVSEIPVEVSTIIRTITDVKAINNVVRMNKIADPAKARRNYKATSEIVTMIETVKAEAALIGNDPAAQLELSGAVMTGNVNGDANAFTVSESVVAHNYYPVNNHGTWTISAFNATGLTPTSPYTLYIKASKSAATATYILSATKVGVEDVAGYYMFPVGILSSVIDGARIFTTTKGYTLITGDSIKTGTFTNTQGEIVLNLDTRTFYGTFTFANGENVQTKVTEAKTAADSAQSTASSASSAAAAAQAAANEANNYINSVLPTTIAGLQSQIDGNITSWFFDYEPNLSNVPASNWVSEAVRDIHLGDLFYWTSKGYSYRFQKVNTTYSWTRISDTDVTKALADAAKAQDTADGKRRVFVSQPTDLEAYDVGDLWANATYGSYVNDLLKCKTQKLAGAAFNIAHWEKATKYTDDTAVNNLQIGGVNLLENGNFEDGGRLYNFGYTNTGSIARDTSTYYEGSACLKGTNINGSSNYVTVFTQDRTVGETFTISGYAKADQVCDLTIASVRSNWGWNAEKHYTLQADAWTRFVFTYTIGDARNFVMFGVPTGVLWLDMVMLEEGNKASTFRLSQVDINLSIADAKQAGLNAQSSANTANSSVSSLNTYVDGAFKDGVVSQAEAAAIDTLNKQINIDYDRAINDYNVVYANSYLTGSAKTDLLNAKITLIDAKTNLQNSINTAIADGQTTPAEKADVDAKFATYSSAYKSYQTALSNANKAIQQELDRLAGVKVDAVQVGGRNLISNGATTYSGTTDVYGGYNLGPWHQLTMELIVGQQYTLSWKQISGATPTTLTLRNSGYVNVQEVPIVSPNGTTFTCNVSGVVMLYFYGPQNSAFSFTNFQLEKGNRATDFTVAPEVTAAAIAAAQADATFAKARTEGRTVISGGVVETQIVQLGEGGIAGMSGIPVDGNGNPLPSRWTGGTYAQAISKLATIIEWFNGEAKFGDFWINTDGSICIKDANGVNRVVMTRNDITTLSAIANSTQNTSVSNAADSYSNSTTSTVTRLLPNQIVVNNNNSLLTFTCQLIVQAYAEQPGTSQGMARVDVYLNNNVSDIFLGSATARCIGNTEVTTVNLNKQVTVAAGTYKIKLVYTHQNWVSTSLDSSVGASTTTVFFDGSTQRTEFGKNGVGVIGNATNYSFFGMEGGVYKSVEKVSSSGVWNKPGVLLSGDVLASATPSFGSIWGITSSSATVSKVGTGIYRIYHNFGFAPKGAVASAKTKSGSNFVVAMVTAKNSTYVDVSLGNGTTAMDASFEFEITGNNQ
jgi:hypothetical protein